MYRVCAEFYDLTDRAFHYLPGDTFPREGIVVDDARLEMLASDRNRLGHAVIEKQEEAVKPAKTTRKRVKKNAD